ncbi:MAG TPA: hypothetical protein VK471_05435 [Solirubrobacterales bacterium]|nr:hypothetical protein [Solirubrobacterales bacterium]
MASRLREPFGKAGLIVAIVALVAATVGGAYAANQGKRHHNKKSQAGLNAKQKGQVKTIAKSFQGTGPAGPQGPAGSNGSNGSDGAQGAKGDKGDPGVKGDTGEAGMCSEEDPECVLGEGATLTGIWSASGGASDAALASISFPVRVSPAPAALYPFEFEFAPGIPLGLKLKNGATAIYGPNPSPGTFPELEEDSEAYEEACPGSFEAPEAGTGLLCIYTGPSTGELDTPITLPANDEAANEFGIVLPFRTNANFSEQRGSWAVTG